IVAVDSYYRPLFNVLFTMNYAIFGTKAWGWHLVNVLIHSAVTYLVFVVVRELTGWPWVALFTAGLFAVHPAHAESISWVSGITDPLMAMFVLPAFLLYLRFSRTGKRRYVLMSLTLYFGGLLCKETAVMLPIIIAWWELANRDDSASFNSRLVSVLK